MDGCKVNIFNMIKVKKLLMNELSNHLRLAYAIFA